MDRSELCTFRFGGTTNCELAKIRIPYETAEERGVFLDLELDSRNLAASFIPAELPALRDVRAAVAQAVENPVAGKRLSEILLGARNVAIITENQFRQAPLKEIIPYLLQQIDAAGATARIVIGCGKVPALSPEEIAEKFGAEVANTVEIHCNDVTKPENYVYKGITKAGVAVSVHRVVAEADVILTVATTQATLWGYGGSGMVIPAVAGNDTIEYNHVMALAPDCVPGNNDCRMQLDKYEAAAIVGLDMGINLIVNNRFEVTYINAGGFEAAHKEAVKVYDQVYRFDASAFKTDKADIVLTGSSAPTNHLFFHTGWAAMNCLPIVKKGGTIIFASPCPGYHGWPGFALMDLLKPFMPATAENHEKVLAAFYDKKNELWAGCIWYKVYAAMLHAELYVVTLPENFAMARDIGLKVFAGVEEAYQAALRKQGPNARVAFVPYGRYTILDV
ncbi:MAG: lactate racemase domain-containing protein [Negativicutes bacterium]|nr:lactate racemase domain-containing protein [Negativicutes bacterium]